MSRWKYFFTFSINWILARYCGRHCFWTTCFLVKNRMTTYSYYICILSLAITPRLFILHIFNDLFLSSLLIKIFSLPPPPPHHHHYYCCWCIPHSNYIIIIIKCQVAFYYSSFWAESDKSSVFRWSLFFSFRITSNK